MILKDRLRFSPDGERLFHYRYVAMEVLVRRVDDGALLHTFPGNLVGMSRDGQILLTETDRRVFAAWDTRTGGNIEMGKLSPDDFQPRQRSYLRAYQKDRQDSTLEIYDVLSGQLDKQFPVAGNIDNAQMSPDGQTIALAVSGDGGGWEWSRGWCIDIEGNKRFDFRTYQFTDVPLLYIPDDRPVFAIEDYEHHINILDLQTGELLRTLEFEHYGGDFIRIGPQASPLVALHLDGFRCGLYSNMTYSFGIIAEKRAIRDAEFHPDGQHIAMLLEDGEIRFYGLDPLEFKKSFV